MGLCRAGKKTCLADGSGFGACEGQVQPAVETCATQDDDNCDGSVECQGIHVWSKLFGGPKDDRSSHALVDDAGNVVLAGRVEGGFDFGGGLTEFSGFALKLDAAGKYVWSKSINANPQSIAMDKQGNVLVGGTGCSVTKLTEAGEIAWSKEFGCGQSSQTFVGVDGAGNPLIASEVAQGAPDFGGGTLFGGGSFDVFTAKLDAAGNHIWSKAFGDALPQGASGVAGDAAGNLYIAGEFEGEIDLGGGPLQAAHLSDVFVAKLGPTGQHLWSKAFYGSSYYDYGGDIGVDGQGGVVITGSFSEQLTIDGMPLKGLNGKDGAFLVKLDETGKLVWGKALEGDLAGNAAVTIDAKGNIFAAGAFEGSIHLGGAQLQSPTDFGLYLGRFDAAGSHVWSKAFGLSISGTYVPQIAIDTDAAGSAIVLSGYMSAESFDLGGGPLMSAGLADIFVSRFTP